MSIHSDFWIERYSSNVKYRNLFPYDHVVSTIYYVFNRVSRPLNVLELGCGCGNNLLLFPRDVLGGGVGLDISTDACNFAAARDKHNRFSFISHDLEILPYPIELNCIDLVIDRSSLSLFPKSTYSKIFHYLRDSITSPFYFYSNPYSDLHSSRPSSGPPVSNGPNSGAINASYAEYYSRNDILEIIDANILDLRLINNTNFTDSIYSVESEWRCLAYVGGH